MIVVLRIQDVYSSGYKNSNKREGCKKISCTSCLCSHKYHKIKNYFIFEQVKKKLWANLKRIIELFTQKNFIKLLKIWIWDPGSETETLKKPIPDPGSRGQKDTGSRIRNHNRGWQSSIWRSPFDVVLIGTVLPQLTLQQWPPFFSFNLYNMCIFACTR